MIPSGPVGAARLIASTSVCASVAMYPSAHAAWKQPGWRGSSLTRQTGAFGGFGVKVAPWGLSRQPIELGPTRYGVREMKERAVVTWYGNASSVSMAERSSAAWTIGHVV